MSEIQKTTTVVPGVELIYLEDLDVAGIHIRGLARLIGCNPSAVHGALTTVRAEDMLEAEIQTEQGLRAVQFVLENGVVQILETLLDSKCKKETKDSARSLYRQFAKAGFKLYAMLKVAPESLKAKVDDHIQQLEALRLKKEILDLENQLYDKRHYAAITLPETIRDMVLGLPAVRVEYRDRLIKDEDVIRDGETMTKTEMCHRLGLLTKGGKPDFKRLNALFDELGGLGLPEDAFRLTVSLRENSEFRREFWPMVERYWKDCDRQRWLGEDGFSDGLL